MTTPMAAVGLLFDGEDVQIPELGVFLEISRGLNEPPSVRGTDVVVPGLPGRDEGSRMNDVLNIQLVGLVDPGDGLMTRSEQQASYRANMLYVRELFRPNRSRATLLALLEDGSTATIQARPLNAMYDEHPGDHAHPDIQLEGYDDWVIEGGS